MLFDADKRIIIFRELRKDVITMIAYAEVVRYLKWLDLLLIRPVPIAP